MIEPPFSDSQTVDDEREGGVCSFDLWPIADARSESDGLRHHLVESQVEERPRITGFESDHQVTIDRRDERPLPCRFGDLDQISEHRIAAALWRGLTVAWRIMARVFCAALPDRRRRTGLQLIVFAQY